MIVIKNVALLIMIVSYCLIALNVFGIYKLSKGYGNALERLAYELYGFVGLIRMEFVAVALLSTVVFFSI